MRSLILALLTLPAFVFATNPKPSKINWIAFEKAIELNKTNPKPIIIDIYTDWCGWCKKMDETTYNNPIIANYINQNFYAVKFNAEQKDVVEYKGQTFNYVAQGRRGVHELAYALLKGKMGYPATVFLDKNTDYLQVVPGYISANQMEKVISFMAEEIYLNKDFTTHDKEFKSKL